RRAGAGIGAGDPVRRRRPGPLAPRRHRRGTAPPRRRRGAPVAATDATWAMPGRSEARGEPTDSGCGRALLGAVERGLTVRAEAADGPPGTLEAATDAFPGALHLEAGAPPALPAGHWGRYVHTVLARLTDNFGPLRSARLTVSSDLPPASGMSSSSAMI